MCTVLNSPILHTPMTFSSRFFLIALLTAALCSILHLAGIFTPAEARIADSFLRFRPKRERTDAIVFLEVDDEAAAHIGVFPWPRSIIASGLLRLKEYGVGQVIFDIEYIDKSPPGVDSVYLERELPGAFSQSAAEINANVRDLFSAFADGRLSRAEAGLYIEDLTALISAEEEALLEKARGIARNNDEYLAQSLALFGDSWATVNLQTQALSGEQGERRARAQEKFSYALSAPEGFRADLDDSGIPYIDVLPPIPPFMEAVKGAGFTNSFVDKDGVRRRIFLARNIQGYWYLQLAFAPLLDWLGNPELRLEPGRLTLQGASLPGTSGTVVQNITIPLDSQGAMLLDWPVTSYRDSFTHLSFTNLFLLDTDEQLLEQYLFNLATADLAFFAQFDEDASAAYGLVHRIRSLLAAAARARSQALAENSDTAFAEYLGRKAEGRARIHELAVLNIREKVLTLAEALSPEYPNEAVMILDEAAYIKTNLEYLQTILTGIEEREARIKNILAGKMCILGRVDTGSTDFGVNPFYERYENPGIHAVVIDTILSGAFITPLKPWWSAAMCLLLVPLIIMVLSPLKPALRSLLGLGGAFLVVALSFGLFSFTGIYLDILGTVLAMVLSAIIRELNAFINSEQEKQFIRKAFSTYVSGDVVEEILKDPSLLQLGGSKREMTAIFTDVQSFSSISEALADPSKLVELLNIYLTEMSDIVLANQGTIDKYEGDAIIAFFGAPLHMAKHAALACRAAIQMKKAEVALAKSIMETGMPFCEPLRYLIEKGKIRKESPLYTRIGINTGDMVVGNMGTPNKMDYTIMGNAVNLAARLEGVNKQYDTSGILISEYTQEQLGDEFVLRPLDRVRVVGIDTPLRLFELLALKDGSGDALFESVAAWTAALQRYEDKDFAAAAECFQKLAAQNASDRVARLYLARCRAYLKNPPPKDWDAVNNLTSK
ncbi:CHASE2 domain-containing protein [Breznakiellaceae bacterium SP9]